MQSETDGKDCAPELAEILAAVNRFRLVDELEPEFYGKYWISIKVGTCVIEHFTDDDSRLLFALVARSALDDATRAIREILADSTLTQAQLERADGQLDASLRSLRKACKAPDLPEWLECAKAVIDRCFVE